ncbi:MAG: ribonuclease R, partial [Candidatus Eisenbacteria bacterium]|nr:ribonuclease R [Candidatus Eisenbacteria bacterium]
VCSSDLRRGTSTYFPGEVFPMLPEILSAGHLSLQPGMDRRAVTVHMTINAVGEVTSSRLTESLINSDARLDYGQVLRVLNKAETLGEPLDALLYKMFVLSRLVRKNRFSGGGYDLCIPEAELTLDGDGIPVELTRSVSDISHQIIEEFMILANREACAFVVSKGLPYLFRVHDQPDPASMEQFIDAVIVLKPSVRQRDLNNRPRLRRWLASLSPDDPLTRIIHYHFLRSLKKAEYAPIDLGHFGLGLHGYGHFTSPIRRYPDLWNHRLAKRALRREGPLPEASKELAAEVAAGSTEKEKNSEAAEREIIRIKILRWAERHLGEVWAGYVIECTPKGFHVELEEVPVEGFVPADGIPFPAKFQEGRFQRLKGRKGSDIQPGDRVEVQLVRVDLRRRWLDLALKTGSQPSPSKSRRTRRSKGGSRRPTPRKNARKDRRRRR